MKKIILLIGLFCFGFIGLNAQKVTLLSEDFEFNPVDSLPTDTVPPTGWKNVQYYSPAASQINDYWHFDDPGNRKPGGGFSGIFAIFDSETYSNDASLEDIGLESPEFSTIGYDSLFLAFDIAAEIGTNSYIFTMEVYNGNVWQAAYTVNNSTFSARRDTVDISAFARNSCFTKVRARYYCQSGGWVAIDNIEVFSNSPSVANNVQMMTLISPLPNSCADPNAQVTVRLKNAGTIPAKNIPFRTEIYDGNETQIYNYTFTGELSLCADTIIVLPDEIDVFYDSTFDFTIYSNLASDEVRFNSDTIYFNGFTNIPPPPVIPNLDSFYCGQVPMTDTILIDESNQRVNWYADILDTIPTIEGPGIDLGLLNKDSTLFMEVLQTEHFSYPSNSTAPVAGGAGFAPPAFGATYLDITAKADIRVDSLEVKIRTSCTWNYEIYITKGSYVPVIQNFGAWDLGYKGTTNVTIGARNKIYVGGIKIKKGETVGFHIFDGGDSATGNGIGIEVLGGVPHIYDNPHIKTYASHFTQQTANSPGTVVQVLDGFGYYLNVYYSIECGGAYSERTYRKPSELPVAEIKGIAPFNGKMGHDIDTIMTRTSYTYEMEAPYGFTNADFMTKWAITEMDFETINGTPVPLYDYTTANNPPSAGNNLRLTYMPSDAWADSLLNIRMVVKNLDVYPYCDTVINRQIFVTARPKINLTYDAGCQDNKTSFTNTSTVASGNMKFYWDFDNGESSILTNPVVTYKSYGDYDVSLTITNDYGLKVDTTFNVTILEKPDVNFTHTDKVCAGNEITTTNVTVFNTGTFTSTWSFGDGNKSSVLSPVINYANGGVYALKLVAEGDNGCADSLTKLVTIHYAPIAGFTSDTGTLCEGAIVDFTNTTQLDSGSFFSQWDFGVAGTSNKANPQMTFANGGSYNVELITFTSAGCRDTAKSQITISEAPKVDFDIIGECSDRPIKLINNTVEPSGSTISYLWELNFESQSTDKDAEAIFTSGGFKTFMLTATSDKNCFNSKTKSITISKTAKASFSVDNGCAGDLINIVNTTPSVTGTVNYSWDFGDGETMTGKDASHTYTDAAGGDYTITLITVVDGKCVDTASEQISIGEMAICNFDIEDDYLPGHRTYKFVPERADYVSYNWSFGDGNSSTETEPIHQYMNDGDYSVVLVAENADGCECQLSLIKSVVNLGVSDFEKGSDLSVYPNPVSDIMRVDYNFNYRVDKLEIVDYTGKSIMDVELKSNLKGEINIDVSNFANGVYFIKASNDNGTQVKRFVVNLLLT